MPTINLNLEGDGCWSDLAGMGEDGERLDLMGDDAPPIRMALLTGGMTSGRASVGIRIDLPDGRVLLTETSLGLLKTVVDAMCVHTGPEGYA